MRCDDLTRELASPTGALSPLEMAGHIAACPSCAERSRQAARFERVWNATRPVEPSASMMDALWSQASAALEAQPMPSTLRLEGFTRSRSLFRPALLLAQAAAILLAIGVGFVWFRGGQGEPGQIAHKNLPGPGTIQVAELNINVDVDETAFVRIPGNPNETQAFITTVAPSPLTNSLPAVTSFDLWGPLEEMAAKPVVLTSR